MILGLKRHCTLCAKVTGCEEGDSHGAVYINERRAGLDAIPSTVIGPTPNLAINSSRLENVKVIVSGLSPEFLG